MRDARTPRIWIVLLLALLSWQVCACQPPRRPQREVFEEGEVAYRRGDFFTALDRYEAFVESSPEHQLAPLARQRIANIERELDHVLRRRNGPPATYLKPIYEEAPSEQARSRP